jgi:FdhD protein
MTAAAEIYENRDLITFKTGIKIVENRQVATEMPMTIIYNDQELATLVCSPYEFELLAVGFLISEGLLHQPDDILAINSIPDCGTVNIKTKNVQKIDGFLKRNFNSCCGKGRPSLHYLNDYEQLQPLSNNVKFSVKEILRYAELLNKSSDTYRLTGGVHEAALGYKNELLVKYEDIGRHNALDRILGYTFLNKIDNSDKVVILSGRIASEMLTKSARIGVPVIVSRSAPTCLSIDLADALGITLVCFTRTESFSVYTHPDRITE